MNNPLSEEAHHGASAAPAGEEQWFWVKALYKAIHPGTVRRRHLWERTIFLVWMPAGPSVGDMRVVQARAEEIARAKQVEYLAAGGERVQWTFQGIEDIQCLHDPRIEDGTEVYWEFFEKVDKVAPETAAIDP